MKLHHLALQVTDIEACEKFYRDVLQLSFLEYKYDAAGKIRSAWFDLEGSILMLEKVEVKSDDTTLNALAFSITPTERETWKKKLTSAKIELDHESKYSLYFRDPAENQLALSHYPHEA